MKKVRINRTCVFKRLFGGSAPTSFVRALRLANSKPVPETIFMAYPDESSGPYISYDELRKIKLQLLDLERQRAEAISHYRRQAFG